MSSFSTLTSKLAPAAFKIISSDSTGDLVGVAGIVDNAKDLFETDNQINQTNDGVQATAGVLNIIATFSPRYNVLAAPANYAAIQTGKDALLTDLVQGAPTSVVISDALGIFASIYSLEGNIVGSIPTPLTQGAAKAINGAATVMSGSALAIKYGAKLDDQPDNAVSLADASGEFWDGLSDAPLWTSTNSQAAALLNSFTSGATPTASNVEGSLDSIQNSLAEMADDAGLKVPATSIAVTTANSATMTSDNGLPVAIAGSVNSQGAFVGSGQSTNTDGSSDISATNGNSHVDISVGQGDSAEVSTDAEGNPTVAVALGTSGGSSATIVILPDGLDIDNDLDFQLPDSHASIDAQGDLTIAAASSTANGWQGAYTISGDGQGITYTNNDISLQFNPGDLSSISQTPAGIIDFNLNPSVGAGDVLIDSSNGQVTFNSTTSPSGVPYNALTINSDGSYSINYYDPTTGASQEIKTYDVTGKQTADTLALTPSIGQFVANFVNGAGLQILAVFLKRENLPTSLLASAAAKVGTQTAIDYLANNTVPDLSTISRQIAANITNMASGMLGTEAGVALFKDLGIDPTIASLLGGPAGKAVVSTATQQLSNFIARDVLGFEDAGVNIIDGSETISDYIDALGGVFEDALASAGIGLITSKLAQFIEPNGNPTGEAIGSIIGAAIGSIIPGIGTTLGSIIGDLIGGLFGGHSVGPNGSGQAGYNTSAKQFTTANIAVDNGGSMAEAQALTSALASVCNQFLPLLNGTVVGTKPLVFSISFIQGQFHILDEVNGPLDYGWYFPTAQTAIDFASIQMIHQLAALQEDLDPLVTYALRTSTDTTAQQLLTDMTAARLYSLLSTDPASFNAGLIGAMVNDPSNYQSTMETLARGQQLGFDKLQVGSTGLTYVDTAANVIADMSDLENLLTQGLISFIRLSDPGAPVLSISWARYQANAEALNAISSPFGLAVSGVPAAEAATVAGQPHVVLVSVVDTTTNILTNKSALQTLLSNNQIGSISVTNDNVTDLNPILDLGKLAIFGVPVAQAIQLAARSNILLVGVLDSFANVFNNLMALRTIANKTASISLTDPGTPVFNLTASEVSANFDALAKLANSFTINVTDGPQNPITLTMQQLLNNETFFSHFRAYRVTIFDTAANISAGFDELGALARQGTLASIAPTDTAWNLVLSGNQILVTGLAALGTLKGVGGLIAQDTLANIQANLDGLQALAAQGVLHAVTLTDSSTPNLSITAQQLLGDPQVIARITNPYSETVGVDPNTSETLTGTGKVNTFSFAHETQAINLDFAAGVATTVANGATYTYDLNNMQAVVGSAYNDTSTFSRSGETVTGYGGFDTYVFRAGTGAVNIWNGIPNNGPTGIGKLVFEGVTAANLVLAQSGDNLVVSAAGTSDQVTVWNWFIDGYAQLAQIVAADGTRLVDNDGTLTLETTASQAAQDASMLSHIAQSAQMTVQDTAANIIANASAILPLVQSGPVTSIAFSDQGIPTISMTVRQLESNSALFAKFPSYRVAIADTAANISAGFDALGALARQSTLVSTTPTDAAWNLTLTANQAFVSGVAALETLKGVGGIIIKDSFANVIAHVQDIAALENNGDLHSITVSDDTTLDWNSVASSLTDYPQVFHRLHADIAALTPSIVSNIYGALGAEGMLVLSNPDFQPLGLSFLYAAIPPSASFGGAGQGLSWWAPLTAPDNHASIGQTSIANEFIAISHAMIANPAPDASAAIAAGSPLSQGSAPLIMMKGPSTDWALG